MSFLAAAGGAAHSAAMQLATWIAAQPGDPDPNSGKDPEWGKAAPAGLLIWLFLGVALFLLIKSMNRHMKRVPKTFDADDHAGDAADEVALADELAGDMTPNRVDPAPGADTGGAPPGGAVRQMPGDRADPHGDAR